MKILWVTFVLPHLKAVSGANIVIHGELIALSARHEITLVTFAAADAKEKKILDRLRASGVHVHVVGEAWPTSIIRWKRSCERMLNRLRGRHPWSSLSFADPRMQRLLDHVLAKQHFDLLQVEDIGFRNYRYSTRRPSVLTEHEVLTGGLERDREQYQATTWRQFDRIQVFTAHDAETIRAIAPELGDRVRINPFGIRIPAEADPRLEEVGTVVFVGGFYHPANVDAAIWLGSEIMPLLRSKSPGIRLKIVGSSPPRIVRALARGDVVVTGRVPAVEPYLERAAVVLAPVRTGGGMRVKVLQAMAMGKAVVTTALGAEGLSETADRRPLAIGETAEDIASATATLLASREDRHILGSRARAFVKKHHNWSVYAKRLESIYAELFPR